MVEMKNIIPDEVFEWAKSETGLEPQQVWWEMGVDELVLEGWALKLPEPLFQCWGELSPDARVIAYVLAVRFGVEAEADPPVENEDAQT